MLKDWIWLTTRKGLGTRGVLQVLDYFGSPERAFYADPEQYDQIPGLSALARSSLREKGMEGPDRILGECDRLGLRVLTLQDGDYPERLREIPDPPAVLYIRGTLFHFDQEAAIGIVGAREPSPYGEKVAAQLGLELARNGVLLVSGIAQGIDSIALKGALQGGGRVVSVLGGGVDVPYPWQNRYLYEDVAAAGALISEYPPGTRHNGEHFPVRNRIISGLALGIDGAAHKGALEAGGKTFAVLGCGADQCYPRENYGLFKKMELQGGILSEFVPGTSPLPMNFPMRNRIISGLSDAVILVEAREKSGSLITADLALEQGKEVFAVPGRITDPLSRGCNRLIQNGAAVCLGPEDVLEAFGIKFEKKTRADKKTEKRLAKNENMVYSFLDSRSGTLEEIMDACGLSVTETMECLLKLELMGMVQGNGDQYYCRKL